MVFSQASSKKTRANDWSTAPLARPHAYALRDVKGLLYSGRTCIPTRERGAGKSFGSPFLLSLFTSEPIIKMAAVMPVSHWPRHPFLLRSTTLSFFLFTSDALIVYIHILKKLSSFFFCTKQDFELHSQTLKKLQTLPSLRLLSVDILQTSFN